MTLANILSMCLISRVQCLRIVDNQSLQCDKNRLSSPVKPIVLANVQIVLKTFQNPQNFHCFPQPVKSISYN